MKEHPQGTRNSLSINRYNAGRQTVAHPFSSKLSQADSQISIAFSTSRRGNRMF